MPNFTFFMIRIYIKMEFHILFQLVHNFPQVLVLCFVWMLKLGDTHLASLDNHFLKSQPQQNIEFLNLENRWKA